MGFLNIFKPKTGPRTMLLDLIKHNAEIIQQKEGKTQTDAEYLAICLIIDDLSNRPNGAEGYRTMMEILQSDYSRHLNDVITYLGWQSGKLHLNAEAEKMLRERHA